MSKDISIAGTGGALADVALFEADAGMGSEDVRQEDLAIPFFKLLQAMSPELEIDEFPGRAGQILNTVTLDVYDDIMVLPVYYRHVYNEWRPKSTGGGLANQFDADTGARMMDETEKNEKNIDVLPNGNEFHDTREHYVIMVTGDGIPVEALISMKRTQTKKSRRWNSLMRGIRVKGSDDVLFNPPTFSHVYKLGSEKETRNENTFHNWTITKVGPLSGEHMALYEAAKAFHEVLTSGGFKVTGQDTEVSDKPSSGEHIGEDDIPF